MSSSEATITRRRVGQTIVSGLAVLALHLPGTVYGENASFSMSHRLVPQQTNVAPPIAFGQTINGVLGDGADTGTFDDGTPYDAYTVVIQTPGQGYTIQASSPQIPLASDLYFVTAAGDFVGQQEASVFTPGQVVKFGGTFPQAGTYEISVYPDELDQLAGGYTLTLTSAPTVPPAAPPPAQ